MLQLAAVPILACAVAAQATLPHVVLTDLPAGNPRAMLVEVDPVLGGVQPLSGFPSDGLVPLAVAIDPYDGDLLVALDQGGGSSSIVRLDRSAAGLAEFPIASVQGPVVDLDVVGDDLLAAVDAPNGGVYRMPRRGGPATLVLAQANLTAMQSFAPQANYVMLAWTGRPGTSVLDSGTGFYDFSALQFVFGPDTFANPTGRTTTGVVDLPTALPRQLLSFDDGTFALFVGLLGMPPQPVVTSPVLPAGAADTMHPAGSYSTAPLAMGDAAFPFLYEIDAFTGATTVQSLALPGSPVDFAYGLETAARSYGYGAACGPVGLAHSTSGLPQLGSTLTSVVVGPPGELALLAGGLDDFAQGTLPAPLPGGCALEVAPEVVLLYLLDPMGVATHALSIPGSTSLLGTVAHLQWVHYDPAGLSTSAAFAHWVGN